MSKPNTTLDKIFEKAKGHLKTPIVTNKSIQNKVETICRCITNKAPIRFLMACLLAKISDPKVDIRKPYTEIDTKNTYSGRHYDEAYISDFIIKHNLPCNSTTAFLTPAFRNIDKVVSRGVILVGKPREIYEYTSELLDEVYKNSFALKITQCRR